MAKPTDVRQLDRYFSDQVLIIFQQKPKVWLFHWKLRADFYAFDPRKK